MARRYRLRLPLLLLLFGGLWLLFGTLVAPPLLTAAYEGRGVALLNDLFAAYPSQSLDFFLGEWMEMTIYGALAFLTFAGWTALLRSPKLVDRFVGTATPGTIGAIRVLVCFVLLVSTLWEHLPSTAALPRGLVHPMGVMTLLNLIPGFEAFTASPVALGIFQVMTATLLVLGMVGWRTRWVLPLAAIGYLILGGLLRQYAWFYHTGLLALYLLIVLAMVPSQDGWSLDRLRKLWRGQSVPPADTPTRRYGWARYALWAAFALPYVAAGLSKLRNGGLLWWDATNFKYILFYSTLRPMEFDFEVSLLLTEAPDVVFEVMALTALLGEVLYGLVLFSRRARWILPTAMLLMHIGILFLQNILFFDLILLQVIFFNLRPLRQWIGQRLAARRGRLSLIVDGAQSRQARALRVLGALDLFDRLRVTDRRTTAPAARAGDGWQVAHGGHSYRGAAAYRRVARALPALWPVLPLLYLPGIPQAIARFLRDETTSTPSTAATAQARAAPALSGQFPRMRRLTLAIVGLLLVCWTFRIEFYPLTGMQMFSKTRGPVVTYELVYAHLSSGEVIRAPIEESIPAMSDSRFRRILEKSFDDEKRPLTERFLRAAAGRWNRKAPLDRKIMEIEVQRWQWNYEQDPDDPDHGTMVARTVIDTSSAEYTDTDAD